MAPTLCMAHYALYMTSHPRFMTSQHYIHYISLLYLISNWLYLTALPLYLCCNTRCIYQSQQFWKLSHLAHILHHKHSTWYHNHILWHHSTVFMTSQPLHSWHEIPYIWHHLQCLWHLVPSVCDIIDTIFLNTDQLYLTSNTRCRHNTTTISEITSSICVSLWSHTLYRSYNIHCIYDMAPTILIAQYALYMTSHPWFMTSQHYIHYISLLYLISNWLYLTALPLYLCHHNQIINHITPTVRVITQAQYVWYHTNTYDITSNHYDITPLHELCTHCIHVIMPRIPVIASTAAELLLTVYWVYHICNMCDLKPTICMASYEFYVTSQQLVKTSQLYTWHHSHTIHDITPTIYDITYTLLVTSQPCDYEKTTSMFLTLYSVYMTSQIVNEWHHHHCIWHDTTCICVIKPTWLMTSLRM